MALLFLGMLLGFALTIAVVRGRARLGIGSPVERLVLGAQSRVSLHEEVIQDLRENDPGLASVVESAPAVPVDSVPEVLTATDQKEIEAAQTQAAAVAVAARFIRDPDLREAVVSLVRWRTRRNNSENQYQNSFRNHANRNGYSGRLLEKERIPWAGGGGNRIAIPDLILGDRVLVELKADLTASGDTDRAMGQMLRYLLAWKNKGPAVLAICGDVSPEIRWLVLTYVNTWRKQLNLPVMAFFKQDDSGAVPEMPAEGARLEKV